MNIASIIQSSATACLEATNGRNLKVLDDTGAIFPALMTTNPPIDPRLELGGDNRELALIQVRPALCPVALTVGDAVGNVMVQCLDDGSKWTIIRRNDNPADPVSIQFWAAKVNPIQDK